MRFTNATLPWLGLALGMLATSVQGGEPAQAPTAGPTVQIPWEHLPSQFRKDVQAVAERPTLSVRGRPEEFSGRPALYYWLLEHPDRASHAWRRLGTPCIDINDRGAGRFGWCDKFGSDICWETVYRCPQYRIWYAKGHARPVMWLPKIPVQAVAILHHTNTPAVEGRALIRQQADLYIRAESKPAAALLRLGGKAVPGLAKRCIHQMAFFFSGIIQYIDRHPNRAESLLYGPQPLGRLLLPELQWRPYTAGMPWTSHRDG